MIQLQPGALGLCSWKPGTKLWRSRGATWPEHMAVSELATTTEASHPLQICEWACLQMSSLQPSTHFQPSSLPSWGSRHHETYCFLYSSQTLSHRIYERNKTLSRASTFGVFCYAAKDNSSILQQSNVVVFSSLMSTKQDMDLWSFSYRGFITHRFISHVIKEVQVILLTWLHDQCLSAYSLKYKLYSLKHFT